MITSKCTDCNHRDICKHKDSYDKVIHDLDATVPEPFTLVLNCKHYYSTNTYLTGKTNDYSNWTTNSQEALRNIPYPAGGPEIVY